jgi:folate-dependent tRNA-U54 methylase TrmFO/GidA
MKFSNSNQSRSIVGSLLIVIGAGAIINFFSKKSNQEKASQAINRFMDMLKDEGNSLKDKAKDKRDASRRALEDVSKA